MRNVWGTAALGAAFILLVAADLALASDWTHNGSVVSLEAQGATRKLLYKTPRAGLPVAIGTPLFEGFREGDSYYGKAFAFSSRCGPIEFRVSGQVTDGDRKITLHGKSPRVNARCEKVSSVDETLVFDLKVGFPRGGIANEDKYELLTCDQRRQRGEVAEEYEWNVCKLVERRPRDLTNLALSCDDKRRWGYILEKYEVDHCGGLRREGDAEEEQRLERIAQQQIDREVEDQKRRDEEAEKASRLLEVKIKSEDSYPVQLAFWNEDRTLSWPGGNKAYLIKDSEFHTFRLSCKPGQKICFGAWRSAHTGYSWGVGFGAKEGCSDCCMKCGTGPHYKNLLALPAIPVASTRRVSSKPNRGAPAPERRNRGNTFNTFIELLTAGIGLATQIQQGAPGPGPGPNYRPRGTPSTITGTR